VRGRTGKAQRRAARPRVAENRAMSRDLRRPLSEAWIVDAVRTPIGRYGGALAGVRPDDLAALVLRALVERTGLDPAVVEDVILGCANQATSPAPGRRGCAKGPAPGGPAPVPTVTPAGARRRQFSIREPRGGRGCRGG